MRYDLADSDPEKWVYKLHTKAKHSILERYLGAWFPILGASSRRGGAYPLLIVLDGFAGRGRYTHGELGSPPIIHQRAAAAIERGTASNITLLCGDDDPENVAELERVMAQFEHERVRVKIRRRPFAESGELIARHLRQRNPPVPTFVFADPFGFAGVPLTAIRELMHLPHVEVLLTFMARDMGRFLENPNAGPALDEFFGGDSWKACANADDRPAALLLEYQRIVRPAIAQFATPFRVFEDTRNRILYYLIHLTNHPLGMRQMKRAMVAESPDMTFLPITMRDPNQLRLDIEEGAPHPSLQQELLSRFAGRRMTFEEILNEHYPEGVWLEPAYRAAILDLEKVEHERKLTVTRGRTTRTGRTPRGLKLEDAILFH